jgi:pimeloyl-ACP methyl ester carboxylesterase
VDYVLSLYVFQPPANNAPIQGVFMPTANVNGNAMHYVDQGDGAAGTVVLLHGFPLDSGMWTPQIEALAAKRRIIAPDFRGFGQSAQTGAFTIEGLADDIHGLAKELGLQKFFLAGLSMGGYVALAYVKKYAATLKGLILLDTKAEPDTAEGKINRDRMIAIVNERGAKPIADAMLPKLMPAEVIEHRPQLVKELREMMEGTRPETIAQALAAMRDRPDRTAELEKIEVPTLVIVGEKDAITPPEVMRAMAEKIPGAVVKEIVGAGHMSNMEQASQVNGAMEEFMGA